jgi:hypothetical protein
MRSEPVPFIIPPKDVPHVLFLTLKVNAVEFEIVSVQIVVAGCATV